MSQSTLTSPFHTLSLTRLFSRTRPLSATSTDPTSPRRAEFVHRPMPTPQSLDMEIIRAQARVFQSLR